MKTDLLTYSYVPYRYRDWPRDSEMLYSATAPTPTSRRTIRLARFLARRRSSWRSSGRMTIRPGSRRTAGSRALRAMDEKGFKVHLADFDGPPHLFEGRWSSLTKNSRRPSGGASLSPLCECGAGGVAAVSWKVQGTPAPGIERPSQREKRSQGGPAPLLAGRDSSVVVSGVRENRKHPQEGTANRHETGRP
jgi:hypothetical protein